MVSVCSASDYRSLDAAAVLRQTGSENFLEKFDNGFTVDSDVRSQLLNQLKDRKVGGLV